MKRLKNLSVGIACIQLSLFFFIFLIFNGQLKETIKSFVLTSCYMNIPGGVFSSPVSKLSISKTAVSGVFAPFSFEDSSIYIFTFPEQGFYAPYFALEYEKKTETETITLPVTKVTLTPSSAGGYTSLKNFLIKDGSTKNPDMSDIFKRALTLGLKSAEGGPQVLILHTHSTESYNLNGLDYYTKETSFRTEDTAKNVVAVGEVITEKLRKNGISVIHETELHDKKSYNGAYGRSLETVKKYLNQYPTIKVVLDIHRDSMITSGGVNYRPIISAGNETAAQVMFVVGTGTKALPNDNWKNNLRFASMIQERLESTYPGLMRPMLLRDSRYNMHLAKGYMLIEVGSCGNTLEEAKLSASLVGQAISDELNERLKS